MRLHPTHTVGESLEREEENCKSKKNEWWMMKKKETNLMNALANDEEWDEPKKPDEFDLMNDEEGGDEPVRRRGRSSEWVWK